MHSTDLRRDHIQGMMIGCAIGDALGCSRQGMSRRLALRKYGRKPLAYRTLRNVGLPSPVTGLVLKTAQAIVSSGVNSEFFVLRFQQRLGWYLLSCPVGLKLPTILAAAKCWVHWLRIPTGIKSAGSEAATRSIFTALALNRAGPRTNKWVEQITRVTHTHPIAVDGCQVLASLADTIIQQLGSFDALEVCKKLESFSSQTELKKRLAQLPQFLEQKRSPLAVANHFGWDTGISDYMIPMTVMSCYCFLRYPKDFRRAVESAIRLGGDTRTLGAIVGSLSGTYRGFSELPDHLVRGLSDFAYGPTWISKMVMRLSHWPHGVDDLYAPPGEPVAPLELTTTNLLRLTFISWNRIKRIPCALLTNNQPTRLRRS